MIIFGNKKTQFGFNDSNGTLEEVCSELGTGSLRSRLWCVSAGEEQYTIADMEQFSYEQTARTLILRWSNTDVQVSVRLTNDGEKIKWRINAQMTQGAPIHRIEFPILEGMQFEQDSYLLLTWQNGCVVKNPVEEIFSKDMEIPFWMGRGRKAYINEYPAGLSFQFGAYYSPNKFGYYFSTEDSEAYIKTYTYRCNQAGDALEFIVTNYPENIGTATGYCMPYDFVLEMFEGDWRAAAQRYRQWAIRQKWCAQKLTEKKLPENVKNVDLWRINHTNYFLGTRTQEYFDTTLQLRDALQCNIGLHWYGWNMGKHDVDYPEYISDARKAEGWPAELKEWNDRFTAEGIAKIPYINARLWEKTTASWECCDANAYSVKDAEQQLCCEPWNGYQLHPMCPASTLWQNKCAEMAQEYVMDEGFDGVYLDQVASFNAKLCFDPSHSHPAGGGTWWNNSYHSLLANVRNILGDDKVITTESCCETYIDVFDMFLTLDMNMQHTCFNELTGKVSFSPIPLFNMIYGDYALSYGSVCLFKHSPMRFEYNFMRNTLWGIIPSVDGAERAELDSEVAAQHLSVLKRGVDFYKENKELFLYGRLVDIPDCVCGETQVEWPIKNAGICVENVPSAYAAVWEAADGREVVLLYNFAEEAQTVVCCGKEITIPAKAFAKC